MSVNIFHPLRIAPSQVRAAPLVAPTFALTAVLLLSLLAVLAAAPARATIHQQGSVADPDPSLGALPEGASVSVDASAGVAVLYGQVARPIERLFANRAVRARSGVGHVIDALIVAPASGVATPRSNGLVEAREREAGASPAGAVDARRMRR